MPPLTTTTGTIISDDFFKEQTEPQSDVSGPNADEISPNFPQGDPRWQDINPYLTNGKIPKGVEVQTVVTQKCTYQKPGGPLSPEAIIPPNCEVYKFQRSCVREVRRYLVVTPNNRVLFWVESVASGSVAWVLFCTGQDGRLILQKLEDKFPTTPTELPSDGSTYYWRPPDIIDVNRQDFMTGWAGPQPKDLPREEGWFYDIRYVYKLQIPIRFEGCVVVATYRRAFQVRRNKGPDGPTEEYIVLLDGEQVIRYTIPNCPREPKQAWNFENPQGIGYALASGAGMKVGITLADPAGADLMVEATLSSPNPSAAGPILLKGSDAELSKLAALGQPVRIRVALDPSVLAKETTHALEWKRFIARKRPAFVMVDLFGAIDTGAGGAILQIEKGRASGTIGAGLP